MWQDTLLNQESNVSGGILESKIKPSRQLAHCRTLPSADDGGRRFCNKPVNWPFQGAGDGYQLSCGDFTVASFQPHDRSAIQSYQVG
jgi:hypothetical protein